MTKKDQRFETLREETGTYKPVLTLRSRGRKGEIHGLIGPWPSRTVLYNVLMVSGSDGSHGKVLPSHAKSAENLSKLSGQRNVTQRTRAT